MKRPANNSVNRLCRRRCWAVVRKLPTSFTQLSDNILALGDSTVTGKERQALDWIREQCLEIATWAWYHGLNNTECQPPSPTLHSGLNRAERFVLGKYAAAGFKLGEQVRNSMPTEPIQLTNSSPLSLVTSR